MQRIVLFIAIASAAGLLIWMLLFWDPVTQEGHVALDPEISNEPTGGDFSLTSYRGRVSLSDYHGKIVLLYIGYTWCPDICPTNLAMISSTLSVLSDAEREQVQPLFVSVDPDRDTPQRLKEYVEYFHPSMLGLTGSRNELDDIVERYGAAYRIVKKQEDENYVVDHSADTYIIDRQGKLVRRMAHGSGIEEMLGALRPLLQENLSR
ncbi:MAG: SCO family protein [Candidatus Thiodiazotropha sp.]|jgi:protein SCO1/2